MSAQITLRRGEARLSDLTEALDRLGIQSGGDFVVSRPAQNASVDGNGLGPFESESETSRLAALANFPRSGTQRASVLQVIANHHPHGITRELIAAKIGLVGSSVRPRVRELMEGGFVEVRPDRRSRTLFGNEAECLILTPHGEDNAYLEGGSVVYP